MYDNFEKCYVKKNSCDITHRLEQSLFCSFLDDIFSTLKYAINSSIPLQQCMHIINKSIPLGQYMRCVVQQYTCSRPDLQKCKCNNSDKHDCTKPIQLGAYGA